MSILLKLSQHFIAGQKIVYEPKSHIFKIMYTGKDFLKGILHVVKKDEKTTFLEQNETKNAQIQ